MPVGHSHSCQALVQAPAHAQEPVQALARGQVDAVQAPARVRAQLQEGARVEQRNLAAHRLRANRQVCVCLFCVSVWISSDFELPAAFKDNGPDVRFRDMQEKMLNRPEADLDSAVAHRDIERCEQKTLDAKAKALQVDMRKVHLDIDFQGRKIKKASKTVHEKRQHFGNAFEKMSRPHSQEGRRSAEYNPKVEISSDFDIPSDAASDNVDDDDMDVDDAAPMRVNPARKNRPSGSGLRKK